MYGGDASQVDALAATGSVALGAAGFILSIGVLILAGLTLITIASVARHRARRGRDHDE